MFGATTALLLARAGKDVVLLDRGNPLATSTTVHSTAKATTAQGTRLVKIARSLGMEAALAHHHLTTEAMTFVQDLALSCPDEAGLSAADQWLYSTDEQTATMLIELAHLYQHTATAVVRATSGPLGWDAVGALIVHDQIALDPGRYLRGLLQNAVEAGARFVTRTDVEAIHEDGLRTSRGDIAADQIVVAAHNPPLLRGLFFSRLKAVRHYGVAVTTVDEHPREMTYDCGPLSRSTRSFTHRGRQYLVVVGEGFEPGVQQPHAADEQWTELVDWADARFGVTSVGWHWAAQDLTTPDHAPFIGPRDPLSPNIIVGTGFNAWGITDGTAAAQIVTEQLTGTDTPNWDTPWNPTRLGGVRSAATLLKWQSQVAKRMGSGLVEGFSGSTDELSAGEGAIFRDKLRQVAVSKDANGQLCRVSARCTHLGCTVSWNTTEKSWDCPCHGSRFAPDGAVLEGPATQPLKPM